MATNVEKMNTLELYFFGPLALTVMSAHEAQLDPLLKKQAPAWLADARAGVPALRGAVETQIKEEADVTAALGAAGAQLEMLGPWRRVMEKAAFSVKDPTHREELLKLAGYGLGAVKTPKEAREFLVAVSPLVGMRKAALLERGLLPEVVNYPATTLAILESQSGNVAREKAEADLAGTDTRKARVALVVMLDRVDDSVEIAVQQAQFMADPATRAAAEKLDAQWLAALNEARVLTRARVEKGDVPPSLTDSGETPVVPTPV
jgi:hypothetical protein